MYFTNKIEILCCHTYFFDKENVSPVSLHLEIWDSEKTIVNKNSQPSAIYQLFNSVDPILVTTHH